MKGGVIIAVALVGFVVSYNWPPTELPGTGSVYDRVLRKQLNKKLNVCKSLSIFEGTVKPSTKRCTVLLRAMWSYGHYLFVRMVSPIQRAFPVYILQVRNDDGVPIGMWDNLTYETRINCPPGKLNTVFLKNNSLWNRATFWWPPADYSNSTNSTLHFTVYYSRELWWKLSMPVPFRYQDSRKAHRYLFQSEDYDVSESSE